jgi:peptidoglycan/xylan/chitin deacetylase (PgdA/CDA1 family)
MIQPQEIRVYPANWYGDHAAACSITFDDGTLDQYAVAAPELDVRGIRGTFFVITGYMDQGAWQDGSYIRRLFDWDQARDLAWRGHEVASHTVNHVDLAANPDEAAKQLSQSREMLRDQLPWVCGLSLGWPYWRSSDQAVALAGDLYIAARAGGIQAEQGDWFYGGVNGYSPRDFFRIGARGILSSDKKDDLFPILEEVYSNGGWLVPNFHGVDDGRIARDAVGWEAISLQDFRRILDTLQEHDIWIAPFGTVARYILQRDALEMELASDSNLITVRYSSPLDPAVFDQELTLVLELSEQFRIGQVYESGSGKPRAFTRRPDEAVRNRYLINAPPGDGDLHISLIAYR